MSDILNNPEVHFASLTNQEFRDLLEEYGIEFKEINEEKREVKLYQKYKHFKGNNIITIGISKPINVKSKEYEVVTGYEVLFSGKKDWRGIFIEVDKEGNLYHDNKESKQNIILYKTLNMNSQIFARTEKEFLSKVNKEKYPDCEQEYILEELA